MYFRTEPFPLRTSPRIATFRLTSTLETTPENSIHKYKIPRKILDFEKSKIDVRIQTKVNQFGLTPDTYSPLKRCHSVT